MFYSRFSLVGKRVERASPGVYARFPRLMRDFNDICAIPMTSARPRVILSFNIY